MSKDYYKILGIERSASKEDIKKAFHKLAHKFHPDKSTGDEGRFKEISEAYSVLSDDKKRAKYDSYGRVFDEGTGKGAGFGGFDFSDFAQQGFNWQNVEFDLGDVFSEFFGGAKSHTPRGRDISIDIEVTFRDSVFGTERSVLLTKPSVCTSCRGSGAKEGTEMVTCGRCSGSGKIHEVRRSPIGSFSTTRLCELCRGAGKMPKEKCGTCHGSGIQKKEQEITISIPAGIGDGEMIRLTGAGEALQNGVPGDLYVKIHVHPDPVFRKEGSNLLMNLHVKLSDALLGASYTVQTLDGPLSVKIPTGVPFGEIIRIPGKGVLGSKGKRGDLLIRVEITLPKKLSRKAHEFIEKLKEEGI